MIAEIHPSREALGGRLSPQRWLQLNRRKISGSEGWCGAVVSKFFGRDEMALLTKAEAEQLVNQASSVARIAAPSSAVQAALALEKVVVTKLKIVSPR